jgi:hypothetical protein
LKRSERPAAQGGAGLAAVGKKTGIGRLSIYIVE